MSLYDTLPSLTQNYLPSSLMPGSAATNPTPLASRSQSHASQSGRSRRTDGTAGATLASAQGVARSDR